MRQQSSLILGIESSCDDTSAAILKNDTILSNVIAGQAVHEKYGGVVPELASRAHQQNLIPVVQEALSQAGVALDELDGIAFTRGPGLLGSLVVGTSFAKALALSLHIPLMDVNHMHGHVLAHFINRGQEMPQFPFICLTVSGGHTQLVLVRDYLDMEVVGTTIDDAAGEAFDKVAKLLGFPYPGGPLIDKFAKEGDPKKFQFSKPQVPGFDFSFSGLKTSVMYFLQKQTRLDSEFVTNELPHICASVQATILDILFKQLVAVCEHYQIKEIAIAGGVSANSGLRNRLIEEGKNRGWNTYIPPFEFCTDNAAMIAIAGKYLFDKGQFADQRVSAMARLPFRT